MSRRPDYADSPGGERARLAAHRRCVCGDRQPCTCTPSPGWRPRPLRPLFWRDLLLIVEVLRGVITPKFDEILREIRIMGAQTDAGIAHLKDDLSKVRDGWAALIAERDQYKAALESADADKAAAVASALDADDAHDAASIAEADALVHDLVNQAEQPPADSGSGGEPAPADEPAPVVEPAPDQPVEGGDSSAPVE